LGQAKLDDRRSLDSSPGTHLMISAMVAAFLLGTTPAFACLLWTMTRLSKIEEQKRLSGTHEFLEHHTKVL
jgi:hypothetical protein